MNIERAKLSCYTRVGNGYGTWEIDLYIEGEKGRRIVNVSESALMNASGSMRKGTVKTPQAFLDTPEGMDWLMNYLQKKALWR